MEAQGRCDMGMASSTSLACSPGRIGFHEEDPVPCFRKKGQLCLLNIFFLREKILNILIQFRTRNAYGAARAHSNKDPCSYLQRGFFLSCGMETKMDSKKEV
jgi:hypothetical protein